MLAVDLLPQGVHERYRPCQGGQEALCRPRHRREQGGSLYAGSTAARQGECTRGAPPPFCALGAEDHADRRGTSSSRTLSGTSGSTASGSCSKWTPAGAVCSSPSRCSTSRTSRPRWTTWCVSPGLNERRMGTPPTHTRMPCRQVFNQLGFSAYYACPAPVLSLLAHTRDRPDVPANSAYCGLVIDAGERGNTAGASTPALHLVGLPAKPPSWPSLQASHLPIVPRCSAGDWSERLSGGSTSAAGHSRTTSRSWCPSVRST